MGLNIEIPKLTNYLKLTLHEKINFRSNVKIFSWEDKNSRFSMVCKMSFFVENNAWNFICFENEKQPLIYQNPTHNAVYARIISKHSKSLRGRGLSFSQKIEKSKIAKIQLIDFINNYHNV